MKKILFILTIILIAVSGFACLGHAEYKEGDIVFQISKSKQSSLIKKATGSKWTHCGIIIEKDKEMYVLEASKTVRLTPLQLWIAQGDGGSIKSRRVIDRTLKIDYKQYLGKPYDLAFRFDNDKWYCSELIYDIYKKQLGIELCQPRPVKDYNISDKKIQGAMKNRGIKPDQKVVAPSDLL
ncbi:MAG: hypothetical protein IKX36_04375 [Prevotella sp.]|nr:hypothetical protein [Prevotella sp.]